MSRAADPQAAAPRRRLLTVLGTRPELVKLAPVIELLDAEPGLCQRILHTGQHYSYEMDAIFFAELGLRAPDVTLHVGSGSHGSQTAAILTGVEAELLATPADAVLVLGDTNSTLGAALAAAKLAVPVVHIEAGCRSHVRSMPEEINRVLVDHCASLLLAPSAEAAANLQREGIAAADVAVVGSTSIDAARRFVTPARDRPIVAAVAAALGGRDPAELTLCTVHRAENTEPAVLPDLLRGLERVAERYPVCWPLHPRTRKVMEALDLRVSPRIHLLPPLGYLDILALLCRVRALLTDSGGLQEEAYAVGTPVLVLRHETEWTYLVDSGCAALCGNREATIAPRALALLAAAENDRMRAAAARHASTASDGHAAARIVSEIKRRLLRSAPQAASPPG
jgi:UDP-N-acetylglucosamine 2-epimerase (non-hydrolysing)